ncbi:MAG TPA: hypothetical protein VK425_00785, partial [Acidimicrobiales bacterium]|nr:hypothetical protein [Acidimicrobiales bacterium]
ALVAAGIFPMFAMSAQAQPTSTTTSTTTPATPIVVSTSVFQREQLAVEHEIIARQVQLALLGTSLANSANVTASDRSALTTIITNEQSALATDATNAAAATTQAQLQAVREAMIADERVYVVVTAQVNLVIQADNETVAEAGYTGLVSELTPLVNELNNTVATSLLADITSQVTASASLTSGVSADALALTPSGYPGNQSQIKTWTYQLGQAHQDLSIANNDVKRIEAIALGVYRLPVLRRL